MHMHKRNICILNVTNLDEERFNVAHFTKVAYSLTR